MKRQKKNAPFVSCIIAAGGSGSRMGADVNKIFLELDGVPVLAHTLLAFEEHPQISEIILVARECDILGCKDIADEFGITKLRTVTKGGATRQESVVCGMAEISPQAQAVLIHDAARPLVTADVISDVAENAILCGGAAVGAPCKNTIKETDTDGFITRTVDREFLFEIQTPQGFTADLARRMYENAAEKGICGTDDCFLAEQAGIRVKLVAGSSDNIKITTYDDLLIAEQILDTRKGEAK